MPVVTNYSTDITAKAGMDLILTREENGFPNQGLQTLYLFTDGSGTSIDDELGGGSGLIEHPFPSNNAFSWLSGGGLQLEGSELASFPEFDVTAGPWTLVSAGTITGSVGGTASERLTMAMAFRDWAAFASVRGAAIIIRGGNDWNSPTTDPYYQGRPCDGAGGLGVAVDLSAASDLAIVGEPRVHAMSYNGVDTLTIAIYDALGELVASTSISIDDTTLTTGAGAVVDATLQPTLGGVNETFDGGQQQIEAFARYNRVLTGVEIGAFVVAAAALGAERGRPWA